MTAWIVRLVMDTDAVVAAMRSPGGASAELLRAARSGRTTLVATAPLCLEYEAVCGRAEHLRAAGFDARNLSVFLDALIGNSQAPPFDGRVELPKQQVTENRWTASD